MLRKSMVENSETRLTIRLAQSLGPVGVPSYMVWFWRQVVNHGRKVLDQVVQNPFHLQNAGWPVLSVDDW